MQASSVLHFGDRVAMQCEQGAVGFLGCHSSADPQLVLMKYPEVGVPSHFERSVFTLEHVTTWANSKQAADDEPLMFGHFVRLRHVATGSLVVASRTRKTVESSSPYSVRLAEPESPDNINIWKVVSKYKIRQEGERVVAGDHVLLLHDALQLSLAVDSNNGNAEHDRQPMTFSAAGTAFSFVVSEPRSIAASKDIHTGRCILLFHKEQEAFLALADRESGFASRITTPGVPSMNNNSFSKRMGSSITSLLNRSPRPSPRPKPSPTGSAKAVDDLGRSLCLMYPNIRNSTYNIVNLSFSSNGLWMLETPSVISADVVQLAPTCYRIKHLASGFYLSADRDEVGAMSLVPDLNSIKDMSTDVTLWTLTPAGDPVPSVSSAATFFRLSNVATGSWLTVVVSASGSSRGDPDATHTSIPVTPMPILPDQGGDESDDSEGVDRAVAEPPAGSVVGLHAGVAVHGDGDAADAVAHEPYSDYLEFGLRTASQSSTGQQTRSAASVTLGEKPSYVDVFCAVAVPDNVARNLAMVLGHSRVLQRFVRTVKASGSSDPSRVIAHATSCCTSMRDLIPFCTISEVTDVFEREGLPIEANQRVLIDQQLHLRAVEVLFSPVVSPSIGLNELRENSLSTAGATLSWQVLGAAVTALSGALNELCTLCCRFLKLAAKNNQKACEQLQPFLPAFLCFLQPIPAIAGVISEIVRCTPTEAALATTICQQVLSQDLDVIAENLGLLRLLTDLCYLHGKPNPGIRDIVLRSLCDNGSHIIPEVQLSHEKTLSLRCPAAMHGDPQPQSLVSFCASSRSTTFLAAAIELMAAVLRSAKDTDARATDMFVLDTVTLVTALDEPIPAALRCAFILYSNVLASHVSKTTRVEQGAHVIPWAAVDDPDSTKASMVGFSALRTRVLRVLQRFLQSRSTGTVDAASEVELMPMVNAALSFFITSAKLRLLDDDDVQPIADTVFDLISSLPSPRVDVTMRPWTERTVTYMECVHHATTCISALLDADAARVALAAFASFKNMVPHEATPDDGDDDEAQVAEAIFDKIEVLVQESAKNDALCRPEIIPKLVELSTYDHADLPDDTLRLAFRMLMPAQEVAQRLSESVISFAETTTDRVALVRLANGFRECRELLRVPALRHLHSDAATRAEHHRQLAGAMSDCLAMIQQLPATAVRPARVMMTCFDFHDDIINCLDNPDALASAGFEKEEDHGTIVMRSLRLLKWFADDEVRNKQQILRRMAIISNLALSSAVLLSRDYCSLVTCLLSDPCDFTINITTMIECLIGDVSNASKEHLDFIELITQNTNMETQESMRAAISASLPGIPRILNSHAESMLGVLRALSLIPRTQYEAESLAAAVLFDALMAVMAARRDEPALLEAGCIAGVNIHLEAPLREENPVGEIPSITLDEISRLRDSVFPALSVYFFSNKASSKLKGCPVWKDEQFATSNAIAKFVLLILTIPAVAQYHRLLAGAAADLALSAAHFVTRSLALDEGRSAAKDSFKTFHELLEALEGFLRPAVPAAVTAPLAHLRTMKNIAHHLDKTAQPDAAEGTKRAKDSAADDDDFCQRSIARRWLAVTKKLSEKCDMPSGDDLAAFTNMYEDTLSLETCIRHLSKSELSETVTVALLESLKNLLVTAAEEGDDALVEMQERLNALEATPLISMLLERPSFVVVKHAVKTGIHLLEGGNKKVQDALIRYFNTHDEKFFLTFRKILKESERSISHRVKMNCDRLIEDDTPASLLEDLLRLLQLCCEGHHVEFQNYVRHQQDNFNTYNMCVTVMELLHTALIRLDETTVPVVLQAFNTLTEFCQGPCTLNQEAIVGCNIVTEVNRLLMNKFEGDAGEELMSIKMASIICLSSLLEGSQDATIPNLMLTMLDLPALEQLLSEAWDTREEEEMLDLGFQMYILAGTLISQGDKNKTEAMKSMLERSPGDPYFSVNLCCIEVWRDDDPNFPRLESIFFRKPDICKLRDETKEVVLNKVNRSSIISKHSDFVRLADDLIFEMEHQFGIESFAAECPKWMNPFGLLKAKPRPAEDALLYLGFTLNAILLFAENDPPTLIDILTIVLGICSVLSSIYLVIVRFVLLTPLVAHQRHAASNKTSEDPFLATPDFRERLRRVATRENLYVVSQDSQCRFFAFCALLSLAGVFFSRFFFAFLLGQVVNKYPLLGNIVKAITMNGRQLLLTAFLGVVSIYFFSVVGFLFFHDHFDRTEAVDDGNNCESLMQCFFFSFSKGLRGGGGISESMRDNVWGTPGYYVREAYDTLYFVVVGVIIMNIVFALIVDTFAELRDARKRVEEDMMTTCFICGIDAATFDRAGEGFRAHTKGAHNMWQYLYFMHHLRRKDKDEFTGQESYVAAKMNKFDLSFFPVNRSKSLENAKSALPDDEPSGGGFGLSAADVRRIVEEVVTAQLKEHAQKLALQAQQQQQQGSPADGDGSGGGVGSSLWGLARSRSLAVLRRPAAAPTVIVTPADEAPPSATNSGSNSDKKPGDRKIGFASLLKSVREKAEENRDGAPIPDDAPLATQRNQVARMKKEAKELLELLRGNAGGGGS